MSLVHIRSQAFSKARMLVNGRLDVVFVAAIMFSHDSLRCFATKHVNEITNQVHKNAVARALSVNRIPSQESLDYCLRAA
jgi:hypothetical protein